jgi:hypothetical protein
MLLIHRDQAADPLLGVLPVVREVEVPGLGRR